MPYPAVQNSATTSARTDGREMAAWDKIPARDLPSGSIEVADVKNSTIQLRKSLDDATSRARTLSREIVGEAVELIDVILLDIETLRNWEDSASWKLARMLPLAAAIALGRKDEAWSPLRLANQLAGELGKLLQARAAQGACRQLPLTELSLLRRRTRKAVTSLESSLSIELTGPLRAVSRLGEAAVRALRLKRNAQLLGANNAGKFSTLTSGAGDTTHGMIESIGGSLSPDKTIAFRIESPKYLTLDSPLLNISGWCLRLSGAPIVSVRAVLGGHRFNGFYGSPREDLAAFFGGKDFQKNCGFHFPTLLAREGFDSLALVATDSLGNEHELGTRPLLCPTRSIAASPAPKRPEIPGQPSFAVYYSTKGNYFFREISILFNAGLRELGYSSELRTELDGRSDAADFHLVVAPHEFFFLNDGFNVFGAATREKLFLFNTEQQQTPWFQMALSTFSLAAHVFDIHLEGSAFIQRLGFSGSHIPLGYVENFSPYYSLAPLPRSNETESLSLEVCEWLDADLPLSARPIDVSFVGEANHRRSVFFARAASRLEKFECHLRLIPQTGAIRPGEQDRDLRTRLTSGISRRSKIVLNIHRDDAPYFEWHRIVLMGIWQKALVVSETVTATPPFVPGVDFVHAPLEEIPELLDYYLCDPAGIEEAERIRNSGYQKLKELCPLPPTLSKALRPFINAAFKS